MTVYIEYPSALLTQFYKRYNRHLLLRLSLEDQTDYEYHGHDFRCHIVLFPCNAHRFKPITLDLSTNPVVFAELIPETYELHKIVDESDYKVSKLLQEDLLRRKQLYPLLMERYENYLGVLSILIQQYEVLLR